MQFRKKPIVIEAIEYAGDGNLHRRYEGRVPTWFWDAFASGHAVNIGGSLAILTANGMVPVADGDWICRQKVNGKSDLWPCNAEIFAATYEPADETARRSPSQPAQEPTLEDVKRAIRAFNGWPADFPIDDLAAQRDNVAVALLRVLRSARRSPSQGAALADELRDALVDAAYAIVDGRNALLRTPVSCFADCPHAKCEDDPCECGVSAGHDDDVDKLGKAERAALAVLRKANSILSSEVTSHE